METVVLVDEQDNELGIEEKLKAHLSGKLHRAVSVFLFNKKGELLLQQRAFSKYHSGGLWSNTCCGHPRPKETLEKAAQRRLLEEMGIKCSLTNRFHFIYKALLDQKMTEHELDHVFTGEFEDFFTPDPTEVCAWKWIGKEDLKNLIHASPEKFTVWFKIILPRVLEADD